MNHFPPSLQTITFLFSLSFSLFLSIPHHRETYDSVENGPPLNEIVNFERSYFYNGDVSRTDVIETRIKNVT